LTGDKENKKPHPSSMRSGAGSTLKSDSGAAVLRGVQKSLYFLPTYRYTVDMSRNYSHLLSIAWPVISFSLLLNVHVIRIINDGVLRMGCLLIPVALTTSHQGGIVTMRRIVLLATMISAIFLVTGTTCFAGSISFHRSHGLSLQHWKKGHHRFAGSRKHKRNRLLKHRHLRRHKHKFSRFGLPGGYYSRTDSVDNVQINLVLPLGKQEENMETTKEAEEPLPPQIETLGEENKHAVSSYKRGSDNNTGAHIVEHQAD
jgi:hypothetical protein